MRKILLFLLPFLILALGYAGFQHLLKTKPKDEAITVEEQVWVVAVMPVAPTTLSPTVTLYGRVESPRTATLRAPGQSLSANVEVTTLAVLEGEAADKGQVLVRLEEQESQLNLTQQEAEVTHLKAQIDLEKQRNKNNLAAIVYEEALLKLAQKSLKRTRTLKKQQVSSESAIDEAQQAVEQQSLVVSNRRFEINNHQAHLAQLQAKLVRTVAQRDLARLELARTKIKAPFAGIIAEVFVAVGDRVRSGDALLSIYDQDALEVRAQIPNRYQNIVLKALATQSQLQAHTHIDQQSIPLHFDRVSGKIHQDSGGIDGLFTVVKSNDRLRLGQFVTLVLKLPQQYQVIALPFEAIYGTNRIYKLVDGRMKGVTIERVGEYLTAEGKSQILVRSPQLQPSDQVIVTQLPNAMEGLKVQVGVLDLEQD